ncbi:MAG TPA: VapC toxin family PIN domain ribonuclease [Acidobacteria bacterium]|nr:VapC toxin family PIN domain ribonuclease [Acidobacteriota bacterium]
MTYLLDANTCIKFLNGQSESVRQRFEELPPSALALCSVVKAELFYGAMKSARPQANLEKLLFFFDRFISYPVDDAAAEVCGRVRAQLAKQGKPIGPNDLLIASVAISRQHTLVTHNVGEFSRVEGLALEDWET